MPDIRFYHLSRTPVREALPQLLQKAVAGGKRVVVRVSDDVTAEKLAADLWTFNPDAFLPHGTKADGFAAQQPIWITPGNDNPNGATMAMMLTSYTPEEVGSYELVCDVFDGRDDDELASARARWKAITTAGHTPTYWQQSDQGWEKKA